MALEGALKLKEISYIHAEGYPAGEMKHGPNALIDERLPVMFINTREEGNRASEPVRLRASLSGGPGRGPQTEGDFAVHARLSGGRDETGPNALIDERPPVLFINTRKTRLNPLRKTHSNIVEVEAREGIVISVLTEGDSMSSVVSDHVIEIPASSDLLSPILSVIPLQLLAYHIAVRRGCDVDQPKESGEVSDG